MAIHKKLVLGFFSLGIILFIISFINCEAFIDDKILVLKNGTLIDGTGADPLSNAFVIIKDDRIIGIGIDDMNEMSSTIEAIDLQGATILPGFINAHIHDGFNETNLKEWARTGVTTVRDLSAFIKDADGNLFSTLRDSFNKDENNARLISVGVFMTVPNGYPTVFTGEDVITVTSPEEAAQKAEELLLEMDADLIKIALESGTIFEMDLPQLSLEQTIPIVEVAQEYGTIVSAHITAVADLDKAIIAGVHEIAHMVVDSPLPDAIITRIIEADMYWVPTLELWHVVDEQLLTELKQIAIDNLSKFVQAGGNVVLGTDYAGFTGDFELGMPMKEINSMSEAGMTPMQIIVASTKNAAKACNLSDEIGTLEIGKKADILVVNGNPLEDLETLKDVVLVIHNGKIIRTEQ